MPKTSKLLHSREQIDKEEILKEGEKRFVESKEKGRLFQLRRNETQDSIINKHIII